MSDKKQISLQNVPLYESVLLIIYLCVGFIQNFQAIDKKDFNYSRSFNPNKIQTKREKYVINNELDIFESIYIKI